MQTLTTDEVASFIVSMDEAGAVTFMNDRAERLARASYSRGSFGRMMLPLIRQYYPRLNLNGCSTSIGLAIQNKLERRGYGFHYTDGAVTFERRSEYVSTTAL